MPKLSYPRLYEEAIDNIMATKNIDNIDNTLWKPFHKYESKCTKVRANGIKILLLNAPCNGFGDLIFAMKLSKYLVEWYGAQVTLATTFEKGLLNLGADPEYVVGLTGGKSSQCRRFASLKMNKTISKQDLILVAPIQIDFSPSISDVKKIIPYANRWNTFSFSEYNDDINKNFTFNTGVGNDRDGILLTKPSKSKGKPKGLNNPYSVIYVAASLRGLVKCVMSFIEMIASKYHKKHRKLDVVVPPWFVDENLDKKLRLKIAKYYPNIHIVQKDKPIIVISKGYDDDNTLTFRCDILPVPNKLMMQLMSNSIDDILLTGDQSITDALSCCSKKNIFYQIAPWKRNLAKNLAKYMPNIYLKKISTSCGTLDAISYKSNYSNFVKEWDFRNRARGKLDAIVLSALAIKEDDDIAYLAKIVGSVTTLSGIKSKLKDEESYKTTQISNVKISRRSSTKKPRSRRRSTKKPRRSSTKKPRSRRRSTKKTRKKCPYGVKKDGDCKKKCGPKVNHP
jgi:hypothetical protein